MKLHTLQILIFICFLLGSCKKNNDDILKFGSNDSKLEIGIYKSTIFMDKNDDNVFQVGARGYRKLDGSKDILYLGFTCNETGSTYSELSVDRDDRDGLVSFDYGLWNSKGDSVIDLMGIEVCKIGLKDMENRHD